MTTTAASAASAARSALVRWQFWLVLAALGIVAALTVQVLQGQEAEPYGLDNTDLDGYAGLASVASEEGIQIHRAYSASTAEDLMDEYSQAQVVVLSHGFQPHPDFAAELSRQHQNGREVLWLSDSAEDLATGFEGELTAGPPIPTGTAGSPPVLSAGEACSAEAGRAAESIRAPGETVVSESGCFAVETPEGTSGYALAETNHGPVFTAAAAFTNQHITEEGNAALALGLLGADEGGSASDLIWYTPSGADTVGADQWESPLDYLPGWFWPLVAWLVLCGGAAMVVAGRRVGPVVVEPLPVEVPASETAHGRGRLYQRSNAVTTAARTLRSAHLLRMARLLRLGPRPPAEVIAAACARETGWNHQLVDQLLLTAQVTSNDQLTRYAQQLAELENDLRDSTQMRRRP